ncbi:protein PTST homolog 2, chloroplastic [Pistacia vera]|uniref:protein PTST homolog 2, chloroplastic n=1 Tax=Pistacia vera TaxID=55513 RepID=UPI001262C139|nr:protein PTST homolog 2, chloroplastic [Pistacia vera]
MVSFTTASNHLFPSPYSPTDLNFHTLPSWVSVCNPRTRPTKQELGVSCNLAVAAKERGSGWSFVGFVEVKKRNYRGSSCFSLQKDWQGEGDLGLEAAILEFMKSSENPERFPTKKQLMDAGRMDLVEAITRQGGWLTFGWDLDNDEHKVDEVEVKDWDLMNVEDYKNVSVKEWVQSGEKDSALEGNEVGRCSVSSFAVSSSGPASSSGRSLEATAEEDSGIEGILSRLEKERNINFGFNSREKGKASPNQCDDHEDDWLERTSNNMAVAGLGRTSRPASLSSGGGIINNARGKPSLSDLNRLGNSLKPETWRTWSSQRADFSSMDLKAAEIVSKEEGPMNVSGDGILEVKEQCNEHSNGQKVGISSNQIKSRLQQLESELSSVLHSVRSNTGEVVLPKGYESSSEDLQKLSDAWEFQENEIMNGQYRLRSIRAKLAVLEGKMTLAMIGAQKMIEEKQKRIDDARRDLRLIRTACIVWPNSASEVLLVGSFDGWSSKRKMEKSRTGIFTLSLKLYPGKYEIKFIVDGEWKVDPLRPIVYNGGYENNLLMIM